MRDEGFYQALDLAKKKGRYNHTANITAWQMSERAYYPIIMDSAFWQALGKVTGWDSQTTESENFKFNGSNIIPDWLHIALYYNYLRLTGGDTEKFWLDLLNPNRE